MCPIGLSIISGSNDPTMINLKSTLFAAFKKFQNLEEQPVNGDVADGFLGCSGSSGRETGESAGKTRFKTRKLTSVKPTCPKISINYLRRY